MYFSYNLTSYRLLFNSKCETSTTPTVHTRHKVVRPTLSCPAPAPTNHHPHTTPSNHTPLHSIPSRPMSGLPRATARPTLSLTSLAPTLPDGLHRTPHLPPPSKPHTCTIGRRTTTGVPMASHRGATRTHTLPRGTEAVSVDSTSRARPSSGASARGGRVAARAASVASARARPAAIGRPPRRPAQPSSSGAAPRLQRALCLLKLVGPLWPFCCQPHLHAAVTLQQSVARSAKGGGQG